MLELLMASSLLAVVTAILFLAWEMGAKSWLTASRSSQRLTRIQFALMGMEKGLSSSAGTAVCCQNGPGVLAYPTGYPSKTSTSSGFGYQSSGSPAWKKYAIYYLDSSTRELRYREIPIASSNSAALSATLLTSFDDGSGVHALGFYASGGESVAQNIDAFSVALGTQTVDVVVNSTIPSVGAGGGLISLHSTTLLRN